MLLTIRPSTYYGRKITMITDENYKELSDMNMQDDIHIHLDDGQVIILAPDIRGSAVYISQQSPKFKLRTD